MYHSIVVIFGNLRRIPLKRKLSVADYSRGMVEEGNIQFISPSALSDVMSKLAIASRGLADRDNPLCLVAVRSGDEPWSIPVECGEPADPDNHSIQEHGSLENISSVGKGGAEVLQFLPDVGFLTQLTKGEDGLPGHKWLWEIEEIPPHPVPISEASVGHFACRPHDGGLLGRADNLVVPDLDGHHLLDDRNIPANLVPFAEALFVLAYRTLIFRISQLRGSAKVAVDALKEQMDEGNWYATGLVIPQVSDLSAVLAELYRLKTGFDLRILGESPSVRLIHHVREFRPFIRYTCSECVPWVLRSKRRNSYCWICINILSLEGVTWLIVSHPIGPEFASGSIERWVKRMTECGSAARRRTDLRMFSESLNLFASPADYCDLPASDQSLVKGSLARSICQDPLEKGLELLRASPGGQGLMSRIESRALEAC